MASTVPSSGSLAQTLNPLASRATGAHRIGRAAGQQAERRREGDGLVSKKSLEIRHFQAFAHQEEPGGLLPGPPESLGV
jgi:hypothetical protein